MITPESVEKAKGLHRDALNRFGATASRTNRDPKAARPANSRSLDGAGRELLEVRSVAADSNCANRCVARDAIERFLGADERAKRDVAAHKLTTRISQPSRGNGRCTHPCAARLMGGASRGIG